MAKDIEALTGVDATDFATVVLNAMGFANDPDTTTGLTYGFKKGRYLGTTNYPGLIEAGTVVLADNATNYISIYPLNGTITSDHGFGSYIPDSIPLAQVTTAGGVITDIIDVRTAFASVINFANVRLVDLAQEDTIPSLIAAWGLNYRHLGTGQGYINTPSGPVNVSSGPITLTDDATNYVELDATGTVIFNNSGFTSGNLPMAVVTTAGGVITDISDRRGLIFVPGPFNVTPPMAVADLPTAAAGNTGWHSFVTDSNATMTAGIGAVVANGGANKVPVYSDGADWRIG